MNLKDIGSEFKNKAVTNWKGNLYAVLITILLGLLLFGYVNLEFYVMLNLFIILRLIYVSQIKKIESTSKSKEKKVNFIVAYLKKYWLHSIVIIFAYWNMNFWIIDYMMTAIGLSFGLGYLLYRYYLIDHRKALLLGIGLLGATVFVKFMANTHFYYTFNINKFMYFTLIYTPLFALAHDFINNVIVEMKMFRLFYKNGNYFFKEAENKNILKKLHIIVVILFTVFCLAGAYKVNEIKRANLDKAEELKRHSDMKKTKLLLQGLNKGGRALKFDMHKSKEALDLLYKDYDKYIRTEVVKYAKLRIGNKNKLVNLKTKQAIPKDLIVNISIFPSFIKMYEDGEYRFHIKLEDQIYVLMDSIAFNKESLFNWSPR